MPRPPLDLGLAGFVGELILSQHLHRLVILNKTHRLPDLFQMLRSVIDRRRRTDRKVNQFLLLGSASIDLMHRSAETRWSDCSPETDSVHRCRSWRDEPFCSRCSVAESKGRKVIGRGPPDFLYTIC